MAVNDRRKERMQMGGAFDSVEIFKITWIIIFGWRIIILVDEDQDRKWHHPKILCESLFYYYEEIL